MHLGVAIGVGLGIGLRFVVVESRFRVRLRVRIAFWVRIECIPGKVSAEIDDLVLGLESSTFRVRVMVRIR